MRWNKLFANILDYYFGYENQNSVRLPTSILADFVKQVKLHVLQKYSEQKE